MPVTTASVPHSDTWFHWLGADTTGTTTSDHEIWQFWAGGSIGTITTTATDGTWDVWTSDSSIIRVERIVESAETLASRTRVRIERQELERARKAKARRLLVAALDAKQRSDLDKYNYFFVAGGKSGNKYRVDHGRAGNVKLMSNGKVKQSFCIHPAIHCPNEDTMLAQMVMLKHMEDQFLNKANITYH